MREEKNICIIAHAIIYEALCGFSKFSTPKNATPILVDHKLIFNFIQ